MKNSFSDKGEGYENEKNIIDTFDNNYFICYGM